jgi:FAD/FMN-containing dehydrogenase
MADAARVWSRAHSMTVPRTTRPTRLIDRGTLLRQTGALALGGAALGPLAARAGGAGAPIPALRRELEGDLIARGAPGYAQAKDLYNTRFDGARPLAIAYCESPIDVARAISWARRNRVPLTARSGGHSYGGYSTGSGLVIDVSRMHAVTLANGIATVGAGAQLIDVYTALWQGGRTIPGGSCPTVGIAGLALGGGVGFSSRLHGTTSDAIVGVTLVDAAGRIRSCTASENADLYWACRGGGGGNFGVVTSFRFHTFPVSTVMTFELSWPLADAQRVVSAWQGLAPLAPDALFAVCTLLTRPSGAEVRVEGQYFGSQAALNTLLAPLQVGTPRLVGLSRPYLSAVQLWAGCIADPAQCHVAPAGNLPRGTFKATSDYAARPIPPAGVRVMADWIDRRQTQGGIGSLVLDPYGGAINRVPVAATAFAHRRMLYSLQYYVGGGDPVALRWISQFRRAMEPYVSGAAYVNYIDPELPHWARAYYGTNYARLQSVKKRHDPTNLFHFAQSVRLPAR